MKKSHFPASFVVLCVLCLLLLSHTTLFAQEDLSPELKAFVENVEDLSETGRLYRLFDLIWDWQMEEFPEYATYVGQPGNHDQWTDMSVQAIARRQQQEKGFLTALQSIDRTKFDDRARLDYDLVKRGLSFSIEGQQFKGEYLQINQMGGVQQGVVRMLTMMPTATIKDYEDRLGRLRKVPQLIDQVIVLLNTGLQTGITPPQITLRDVPQQIQNLLAEDPLKSPLLTAFQRFPDALAEEVQQRLRNEAGQLLNKRVYPAFRKLHDYLVQEYIPQARTTIGLSAAPEGKAWYAYNVRATTTTDLSPQHIHELGLTEVKRIRQEMEHLIEQIGFAGSFAEFSTFLRTDPQFFYDSPEALLMAYRDIAKRTDPQLARLFGKLPRLPYGIKAVPAHAEKSQSTAYYEPGSIDAGRPGYFCANTYDLKSRPKWEMEALTFHEAVPGHHLQVALAQELENAHNLRKHAFYTAFVEGWGLYAESLGEMMGFYQDPYAKFGQLTYEMWRAIRLVVDTGMHDLGWSRQRAIDFFKHNSAKAEHDIVVEVDRYIVWPGQALAYKIGELKIKELRTHAEKTLGERFDIRAFHDAVLANGALPLDILEARVHAWMQGQQATSLQAVD